MMRSGVPAPSAAAPDLLAAYAKRFGSVELDSVFYRSPAPSTVQEWHNATNEPFRFTVRIPREITHVDRLGLPPRVRGFLDSLEPLGDRLGAVLFTTPPTFGCDIARFRAVLDALPGHVRSAWEFRHPSWLCPDVLDLLAQRHSAPVILESFDGTSSSDLLPGGALADRWEFPFVYVRFRREAYTYADLVVWGDMLGDVIGAGQDVYAFFRQSPEAIGYATALGELLQEARAATFNAPTFTPEPATQAIR
jgi:uncharacterized protein YecE (DUF72 family)